MGCFDQIESRSVSLNNVTVSVNSYNYLLNFLTENKRFQSQIESHFNLLKSTPEQLPSRISITVEGCEFLCGLYIDSRELYIGTKNLTEELLAIEYANLLEVDTSELQKHIYKIANLSVTSSPSVIEKISFDNNLPLYDEGYDDVFEHSTVLIDELKIKVSEYRFSLFEKISDHALGLSANFQLIRVHLLKFLAILPCLDHDKEGTEVKRVFLEMLKRLLDDSKIAKLKRYTGQKRPLPTFYVYIFSALKLLAAYIPAKVLSSVIRFLVGVLAKRFIAGQNIEKAKSSLKSLLSSGRDATLDQLGELIVSPSEAEQYKKSVLEIIYGINDHVGKGSRNGADLNKAHVSIKVSALSHDFRPEAFEYVFEQVAPRLKEILIAGKENEVFINIDAEHYHYRDMVFEIYKKTLLETNELKDFKDTGIVIQAYLRDGINHFRDVVALAKARSIKMPIRLVKGAYWDAETIEASVHSFAPFEFLNKSETDLHFRQICEAALSEDKHIQLALASHNILDHCFAQALRTKRYPTASVIEHQCLHMTYEALSIGLEKMGWVTRNYIPIGDLLVGMAYLVRRIMENSSQVGILTIMRSHKKQIANISPIETVKGLVSSKSYVYDESINGARMDFKNINPLRVYIKDEFSLIKEHVKKLDLASYKVINDTEDDIKNKIDRLSGSASKHRNLSLYTSLIHLKELLLIERSELCAIIIKESGKTVNEAIADVDEAIDFVSFYLRQQLKDLKLHNKVPIGIVGVIAPWNFPLAIACGMSVAALCTGNKVILKPSECTPKIIKKFLELCRRAGLDEDLFNVAFGGGKAGALVSSHEAIDGVVFTGSKNVGVELYKNLNHSFSKRDHLFSNKISISEMGGKNAIIVTNNCELDETISGILYSAFAHAGQKCSAASRIIVDSKIKKKLIKRLVEAAKSLPIGSSLDYSTYINPLIRESDKKRILGLMDDIKSEGIVHLDLSNIDSDLNLIGPVIIEIDPSRAQAQDSFANKELFAPIIHIIEYSNLKEGIEIFNNCNYALTGGIYCQSQDDIDYLSNKLEAGNLYINRPSTGARVGIEPFGGYKLSGTGPKAGGVDYLDAFKAFKIEERHIENCELKYYDMPLDQVYDSGLSYKVRIEKIQSLMDTIIINYESFSQNIDQTSKEIFTKFVSDVNRGFFDMEKQIFPNTKIEGQISVTKRDKIIGKGIVITNHTRFDSRLFTLLASNLALGNGVNFICTTKSSYDSWREIFDYIYAAGFSEFNVKLHISSISGISKEVINDANFIAYNDELAELICNDQLFKGVDFITHLPRIINVDRFALAARSFVFINQLTHARSFAINTMRHGAPLELEL